MGADFENSLYTFGQSEKSYSLMSNLLLREMKLTVGVLDERFQRYSLPITIYVAPTTVKVELTKKTEGFME